jgi:ADP-ribosylglycohydrolase
MSNEMLNRKEHTVQKDKTVTRRLFLQSNLTAASAIAASTFPPLFAQEPNTNPPSAAKSKPVRLHDKFFGCIAGCHIGSSMGAPVEGWEWERIEREYGTLDKLLPYQHYRNTSNWMREPGTTEDGVERQKLMITAIIEKQDRINAEDLRKAWVEHMNPDAPGLVSEPFEGSLLAMARTPMPAADIGKYCDYSGLVSLSRSCHPIGLINAGDIQGAINDIRDIGQLYNTANSRGILWAEVTVVAIAAATKPNASVDSVLGAIFDNCDKADKRFVKEAGIRWELERALKLTAGCTDFRDTRKKFDTVYSGKGIPYSNSYANEVVTKAVCIFKITKGNTWEAMKTAVNMGRDTDCLAAVAAGISGALTGADSIPKDLIKQVDYATSINPHTNSKRTLRETSDGLYNTFKTRLAKIKAYVEEMDVPPV